jgi:hypothetical protein
MKRKNKEVDFPFDLIPKPFHWTRYDKSTWKRRTSSDFNKKYITRLEEIVDLSYSLLINQIAGNAVKVNNEASFQLQFAYILKSIGILYQYSSNDLFTIELENVFSFENSCEKSKTSTARIDIVLTLGDEQNFATLAIELKYFKAENYREPNNRYDVFVDLKNLEHYKKEKLFDITYFILATDHAHYFNKRSFSVLTKDFDFRHLTKYIAGTELVYSTPKPYGEPIKLENDYEFIWNEIEMCFSNTFKEKQKLYFLKIKK